MYYDSKNYYDILGVNKNASFENISKARDRLKFGNADDRVPFFMWKKIDEAYDVLSNPEKRAEYDKNYESIVNSKASNYIGQNYTFDSIPNKNESVPRLNSDNLVNQENDIEKESNVIILPPPLETEEVKQDNNEKAIVTYNNISNKENLKIDKNVNNKEIIDVQVSDDFIDQTYQAKINNEIEELLNNPLNNPYSRYRFEMNKLRYENEIEMLKKKIELRENSVNDDFKHKFELVGLKMNLETKKKQLDKMNEKINSKNFRREQYLNRANRKLKEAEDGLALGNLEPSKLEDLETDKVYYNFMRNKSMKPIKLINGFVSRINNGIISIYNNARSFTKVISGENFEKQKVRTLQKKAQY